MLAASQLYKRSIKGLAADIKGNQVASSKKRGHTPPSYTTVELLDYLTNEPKFNKLYDNWCNSNYDTKLKPSIDRVDDFKPYTFDNIQLMTWAENRAKAALDKRNGVGTQGIHCKPVNQLSLQGTHIQTYYSTAEAEKQTGIKGIAAVARKAGSKSGKRRLTAGGYKWEY